MKKTENLAKLKEVIEQGKLKKATKQSTLLKVVQFTSMGLIIIAVILFFVTMSANANANKLIDNRSDLVERVYQINQGSTFLVSEARTYSLNGNLQSYNSYVGALGQWDVFAQTFNEMQKLGLTQEEISILDNYIQTTSSLRAEEQKALSLAAKKDLKGASAIVYGTEYSTNSNKMYGLCDQLNKLIIKRLDPQIKKTDDELKISNVISIICIILAALIQVVCLLFVMTKLMAPVKRIYREMIEISQGNLSSHFDMKSDTSEIGTLAHSIHETKKFLKLMIDDISMALSKMAQGNYNFEITTEYIGEFAQIKESLNVILNSSNSVLTKINQASLQVASGSNQVASGAQALSQGATEQASSIQELSAVISEISHKIRTNAQNAVEANRVTEIAANTLQQGNEQMHQMIEAMTDISQASNEISKIIKTIDGIAFQTNILALNAAVEAARAGTAGKGFAVVAEEVRNLASKSAEAAKTTTELIESTIEAVENGKQIADATAISLEDVVENAKKSADLINEISTASNEQADSISQVTQGVDQISGVVQTNSATAEQSAAASEELSSQSQLLNDLISNFELRTEDEKSTHQYTKGNDDTIAYHEPQVVYHEDFATSKY